jgi:hypothetical protein
MQLTHSPRLKRCPQHYRRQTHRLSRPWLRWSRLATIRQLSCSRLDRAEGEINAIICIAFAIDGGLDIAIFAGERADFTVTNLGRIVQVQDTTGSEGRDTLSAIEILQFDDGFLDLRDNSFSDGFANDRVEALVTRPGFSTDPAPSFATTVSTAQVENLVVAAETIT